VGPKQTSVDPVPGPPWPFSSGSLPSSHPRSNPLCFSSKPHLSTVLSVDLPSALHDGYRFDEPSHAIENGLADCRDDSLEKLLSATQRYANRELTDCRCSDA